MALASQDRVTRDALVIEVAALLSTGEPTFFQYEGAIRHALRSSRCRDGWKWQRADDFAAHVLILAFLDLRAARPTWEEGQPVPQETGTTYRLCANCGKAFAKTRRKFCSQRCNNTRFMHRKRNEDRNGYNAKRRAEYYLHKLPETPCEVCGRPFEPVKYGNHSRRAFALPRAATRATVGSLGVQIGLSKTQNFALTSEAEAPHACMKHEPDGGGSHALSICNP